MRNLKFKLIEIEIENFLSYKKAQFSDLKDYNVLIGKNNSGKSNFIKILKLIGDYFSDIIKENVKKFNTSLLFDTNIDAEAKVSLTFKLSEEFIREILMKLSKYLKKFQKDTDKEGLINNLINEGYLNSIKFVFAFDKKLRNLFLKNIYGIHKDSKDAFPILEGPIGGNELHIISNKTHELANNIDTFFGKNLINLVHKSIPKKPLYNTLLRMSNGAYLGENIFLRTIMIEFFNYFKNRVKFIPATRFIPKKDDEYASRERKILQENGRNFVPFIFNKRNTIEGEPWMEKYEKEIFYFFPDIKKFSTDSRSDSVEAYFLENNLTMPIKEQNMGSAIMHIAFLIAFVRDLKENDFLLIEEPELFVFPGLQTKIRDWFLEKSQKIKIFITTHSTKFLSENDEKCSIYSLQKENNESKVKLVAKNNIEDIFDDLNIDLTEYEKDKEILYDNSFWNLFILKAMQNKQIEDELWDLKQTLDWWNPECKVKEQKQIEFCEKVAGFANSGGGVIIIGISDKDPRRIIGVKDSETRVNDCGNKIKKYIDYKKKFYYIRAIKLKDQDGIDKNCIIIVVKQTKGVIGVKVKKGYISYKIRAQAEVVSMDYDLIKENKKDIIYDNFKFLNYVKKFSESISN